MCCCRSTQDEDSTGSVSAIENTLERLTKFRMELEELFASRKVYLDLFLRFKIFEHDAVQAATQFEKWAEDLQHIDLSRDCQKAEQYLRMHNESVTQMQNTTCEIIQQGQELLQIFDSPGGFLGMQDASQIAQNQVQNLLGLLNEKGLDLEELAELKRIKLEQALQLCQFQNDANQVVSWIRNGEAMLSASFSIPNGLQEAEQMRKQHEKFQVAIEKTHTAAVQVKYRADALISAKHYDPESILNVADDVTKKWQQLVTCAEERHKLVTASMNFYKTVEQVSRIEYFFLYFY